MVDLLDKDNYRPDVAIPPGETLLESLTALGISQAELARRMGRPVKTINEIIKGKAAITSETAVQLSHVIGVSASFWLTLEANYQVTKADIAERVRLKSEAELAESYPYCEMSKWGWIEDTRDKIDRARNLLSFFGVTSLKIVPELEKSTFEAANFRRASAKVPSKHSLSAWLRRGELEARSAHTEPFERRAFEKSLEEIRTLTDKPPKDFMPRLEAICNSSGVAIVLVPHLKRTYVNGATRWLTPDKALIQLSLRYRWEDIFWFTFFHEAAHIILHGKRDVFIDFTENEPTDKERQADDYASKVLIPASKYQDFIERGQFSKNAIVAFSNDLGVSPAIVVGRLQHDGHIPFNRHNGLRRRFYWSN